MDDEQTNRLTEKASMTKNYHHCLQNHDEISYQMRWFSFLLHYLNSIASPPMLLVFVYLFLSPFAAEFIGQTSDFFVRGSPDDASPPHSFNFLAPSDVKLVSLRTKSCTRCFQLIQHESDGTAKRNMPFVVFFLTDTGFYVLPY